MTDRIVRAPRDDAERQRLEAILVESFGADELPWGTWMSRLGHENLRVVIEGGAIRGGLGFYRFAQHWGTSRAPGLSPLPMVGLAGVGVSPEARGTGLARRFLVSTLAEAREEGVPLAALYASSVAVYRSIGFEQAGTTIRWSAPIATLPRGDHGLACVPFDPREDRSLRALYDARARRWNGHLERSEAIWQRIAAPYKGLARGYRFGPDDAPEGYVVYQHEPGANLAFAVVVKDLVLTTPRAVARAMALLSDLRSLATELRWLGAASDPIVSLLPEQTAKPVEHGRWMLRILDPRRALALRGYAHAGHVRVRVHDPLFGDVALALEAKDGRAEVHVIDDAPLRIDTRALAALYAGATHPDTLALMGLAEGPRDELHALATLLSDREPWLCDWF
ncbi:MAG: GNAT family N-acetyltransferase [Sandaracinus sp.]